MTTARRRSRLLQVAIFVACAAAGATLASGTIPYDDRPPLLATQEVPDGVPRASHLNDVALASVAPDGTVELVLEADGALPVEVFRLDGPERLVFDLPGVVLPPRLVGARIRVGSRGVVRARLGQYREPPNALARLVLDLTEPHRFDVIPEPGGVRLRVAPQDLAASVEPAPEPAAVEVPAAEPAPEPAAVEVPAAEPVPEPAAVEVPAAEPVPEP
ncbi:MAG: AMIN domain-containing protein, partial [Acidobacteria bacterium]